MPPRLSDYEGIILDVDGVLFAGAQRLSGACELVSRLKSGKQRFVIFSNNSRNNCEEFAAKFDGFDLEPNEILHAVPLAAQYVFEQKPGARVTWVGESGLEREFLRKKLELISVDTNDEKVDFLVVGLTEGLSFSRIKNAVRILQNGARLIALNMDSSYPVESGVALGMGGMIKALEFYSGVKAEIVGKPSRYLANILLNKLKAPPERILVVGDSIHSDIALGKVMGSATVLVGSPGKYGEALTQGALIPDFLIGSVVDLL